MQVGPLRVWIGPRKNRYGLAMTRSIGDGLGKKKGVISTPEVSVQAVTESSKMIIIASDGLWDVVQPQEAILIASRCPDYM